MADLTGIKVGDKIAVFGPYDASVREIVRVTPTLRIDNTGGRWTLHGNLRGSDTWSRVHARPYDAESAKAIAEIAKASHRWKMINTLGATTYRDFSDEQLTVLFKLVEEFRGIQSPSKPQ